MVANQGFKIPSILYFIGSIGKSKDLYRNNCDIIINILKLVANATDADGIIVTGMEAGGIAEVIMRLLRLMRRGVQIGTAFLASEESPASKAWKEGIRLLLMFFYL